MTLKDILCYPKGVTHCVTLLGQFVNTFHSISVHEQSQHQIKRNGRLYQETPYNDIHWPNRLWKTHLVLDLIEKEYKKHFDYIIIICPTPWVNKTYYTSHWIKNNDKVWLIEHKVNLYQWIGKLCQVLARFETLFIINDIIANKELDKWRQPY